ncbi:hypothetical protein A3742_10385 [Oleiphilus sp. HI0071]|nr:hypothetical protein A3737_04205 [Oleiphilus sp. HI0065]KZY79524.1 hypothetical protein A3742_14000 [Oleiphilus sp. HI0071]KZZ00821.1 hypothetical protein A3744_11820 [Oleiphilus sp. HI0073]KZZ13589.1 hypothetical protein A3750_03365 [Oleiphilus sp. HI0079]KZZ48248.1 hypothetical protein A3760_04265 [Oleiphilus sp. HI0122]KZZ72261.1 hypothetical protein A3765_29070 [Oleiphilus sp. HI0130]KZZ79273.1 hypothetical protein A3767_11235 [Oleiphilus sp. HI0133]
MFNQTKVSFQSSWRAFALLLAPSIFALIIAALSSNSSIMLVALFVIAGNTFLAYQAAIKHPPHSVITFNGQSMQLNYAGEQRPVLFDEQIWFGVHWGVVQLKTECLSTYLFFVSPFTVYNLNESRRLKVHATHNNSLCTRP